MKRYPASPAATKLATSICIEVFGRHHVTPEYVATIAALVDAWMAKRAAEGARP